ncbi:MAG: hypothetical protein JXA67_09035 [Micromonosporaceae bacterium]|nr:hypothetical protein [Micromonosporaceae bacterium]
MSAGPFIPIPDPDCPPGAILVASPRLVAPPLAVSGPDVRLLAAGANMLLLALRHGQCWDAPTALAWGARFIDPCAPEPRLRARAEHAVVLVAEYLAAGRPGALGTAAHELLTDLDGEAALRAVRGATARYHLALLYAAIGADGLRRYLLVSAGFHSEGES